MMNKTIEELEKELREAKSSLSYHKNKGKRARRRRGQSPKAREYALAQQIIWNDEKRAMSHVIAKLTTTNDEDYREARNQAYRMPIEDVRDLAKGHEKEIAEDIKQRQEKRKATADQHAITKMVDVGSSPDTPAPIPVRKAKPKSPNRISIQGPKPNYGSSTIQPERDYTTGETYAAVRVKTTTLRLAKEVVSTKTGFDGLSDEQVVGHILSRYLQDNS